MPVSKKPRRKTQQVAPVITVLKDVLAITDAIAELRATLGEATSAPNATRRTWAFQKIWGEHATTQKRLDAITAPGLRARRAEFQRQLDAVHFDATVAAFEMSQQERKSGGVVVSLDAARARRAAAS